MLNFKLKKIKKEKEHEDITIYLEKDGYGDIELVVDNGENKAILLWLRRNGKLIRNDDIDIEEMGFKVDEDDRIIFEENN